MTTPAYLMSAAARVLPKLALDFTAASLDPRITFIRALNTATRVNSSGLIETVNADAPRFNYDPTTLACLGLLIEETRTNAIHPSENMSASPWGTFANGSATVSTTAASGTSPAGTNTATKISLNATGSDQAVLLNSIFFTNSLSYAGSFYVKAFSAGDVGKIIAFRHAAAASYQLITLTNSWQRVVKIEIAGSTGAGTFDVVLRPGVGTSSGAVDFLMWGAQYEQGAFATSYIPTTSAAATRNADVATLAGANFSSWWQATKGGAVVCARPGTVSGTRPWVQFDDGATDNIIALRGNATNPELYIKATTDQAQIDAGTISADTSYALTGVWDTNNCAARLDAGTAVFDASATIPVVTQARLGSDGTNYLNGHLELFNFYDQFYRYIYTRRKNKAVFSLL